MPGKEKVTTTYTTKTYHGILLPDTYMNYVLSKWMRSYRYGNDLMRLTDSESYFDNYETHIRDILNDGETRVRLAVLSDEPDAALGFSVVQGDVLHYVYVGVDYRLNGIGSQLAAGSFSKFSHLTKVVLKIWPKKMPNLKFDMFA
jgi:hypothetical protein